MSSLDDILKKHESLQKEIDKRLDEKEITAPIQKVDEKEETEPTVKKRKESNLHLTEDDRKQIKKEFIEKNKLSRKEQRRINMGERTGFFDRQKAFITIFAISLCFLLILYSYTPESELLFSLVFLVGCSLFLPIGMILGWMFLDSFMRCKIIRKVSRKNFGIMNFVGKGKKIISKIKNFDNDLIWIKNKCWALTKEGIYEIDKYGERANDGDTIDPESIVTITETVPVVFVDLDSMQPLTFETGKREGIMPEELGSTLKGWVDNQQAKVMFLKRTLDLYFLIVIISAMIAAYFGYQNNQAIETLTKEVASLSERISQIIIPL